MKQGSHRIHFDFLDGIRGLSAFYVLIFHVIADGKEGLTREQILLNFFRFGHEAVVIFIVLSGFVLTLPLVQSSHLEINGGLKHFVERRAKRILPGYYAALFLLPLYISLVEISKGLTGQATDWQRIAGLFFSGDMLSHLLLLHNISSGWEGSINPVLWSMGTEWWIYFIFALILVPLWRRHGVVSAFASSLVLGLAPTLLLTLGFPTLYGFPHLLMAFAVGMASAAFIYSGRYQRKPRQWNAALNVSMGSTLILFLAIAIFAPSIRINLTSRFFVDFLLAIFCAGFIIKLSLAETCELPDSWVPLNLKRFLQLKPIKLLGNFSYSLYLTHLVVLNMIGTTLNLDPIKLRFHLSLESMPVRLFIVVPILLVFAYGFYRVFEKPFLRST